jgi:hypothetical protein
MVSEKTDRWIFRVVLVAVCLYLGFCVHVLEPQRW